MPISEQDKALLGQYMGGGDTGGAIGFGALGGEDSVLMSLAKGIGQDLSLSIRAVPHYGSAIFRGPGEKGITPEEAQLRRRALADMAMLGIGAGAGRLTAAVARGAGPPLIRLLLGGGARAAALEGGAANLAFGQIDRAPNEEANPLVDFLVGAGFGLGAHKVFGKVFKKAAGPAAATAVSTGEQEAAEAGTRSLRRQAEEFLAQEGRVRDMDPMEYLIYRESPISDAVKEEAQKVMAERFEDLANGNALWMDDAARRAAHVSDGLEKDAFSLLKGDDYDFVFPERKASMGQLWGETNLHEDLVGPKNKLARLKFASDFLGRPVTTYKDLSQVELFNLTNALRKKGGREALTRPAGTTTNEVIKVGNSTTTAHFALFDDRKIYRLPERIAQKGLTAAELNDFAEIMEVSPEAVPQVAQAYRDFVNAAAKDHKGKLIEIPTIRDFLERWSKVGVINRNDILASLTNRVSPVEAAQASKAGRRSAAPRAPKQAETPADQGARARRRRKAAEAAQRIEDDTARGDAPAPPASPPGKDIDFGNPPAPKGGGGGSASVGRPVVGEEGVTALKERMAQRAGGKAGEVSKKAKALPEETIKRRVWGILKGALPGKSDAELKEVARRLWAARQQTLVDGDLSTIKNKLIDEFGHPENVVEPGAKGALTKFTTRLRQLLGNGVIKSDTKASVKRGPRDTKTANVERTLGKVGVKWTTDAGMKRKGFSDTHMAQVHPIRVWVDRANRNGLYTLRKVFFPQQYLGAVPLGKDAYDAFRLVIASLYERGAKAVKVENLMAIKALKQMERQGFVKETKNNVFGLLRGAATGPEYKGRGRPTKAFKNLEGQASAMLRRAGINPDTGLPPSENEQIARLGNQAVATFKEFRQKKTQAAFQAYEDALARFEAAKRGQPEPITGNVARVLEGEAVDVPKGPGVVEQAVEGAVEEGPKRPVKLQFGEEPPLISASDAPPSPPIAGNPPAGPNLIAFRSSSGTIYSVPSKTHAEGLEFLKGKGVTDLESAGFSQRGQYTESYGLNVEPAAPVAKPDVAPEPPTTGGSATAAKPGAAPTVRIEEGAIGAKREVGRNLAEATDAVIQAWRESKGLEEKRMLLTDHDFRTAVQNILTQYEAAKLEPHNELLALVNRMRKVRK